MSIKIISAAEAVEEIQSGSTLGVTGFRWVGCPEALYKALRDRFLATQSPQDLTLMFSSAAGDNVNTGLALIALPGLLRRVIGGYWGVTPQLFELAKDDRIEAYNFPQGQIARLYGAIASGQPGLITEIGLDTFVDPRIEGGRLNARTPADLLEVIQLRGQEYLLYHAHPIHVAFIRGTTVDQFGNISFEEEAALLESLNLAQATRNSGGKVIVQVKKVLWDGVISPHRVGIPSHLVDAIVLAEDIETEHRQTVRNAYDPALLGGGTSDEVIESEPLDNTKYIIANRASDEVHPGDVVNLGQGIPSNIPQILADRGLAGPIHVTLESGVIGGLPHPVPDFGVATDPQAILRMEDQFAFYDGGGLDAAFLGFAEVDEEGSVNVSKFGGRFIGCGGFIDIAQPTQRVIFCGGFRAGKLDAEVANGCLQINHHGRFPKFVKRLQQRTFSGPYAQEHGKQVKYVTERCVFELGESGLVLTELAPGIDIEKDIFEQMDFRTGVSPNLKPMNIGI